MKYDHIVVGGGTAGCILAAKLSEDPGRSTLLLEAGPEYPDFEQLPGMLKYGWGLINLQARAANSPFNWSFTGKATPQQSEPMPVPRGKVLGGSSAINGQTFIRGAPEDFDTWASWGNDEWSYIKVLPYFRQIENDDDFRDDFHGTNGPIPVRRHKREDWPPLQEAFYQACVSAGYPYNPDNHDPDATGVSLRAENNVDGVRMSMAITHIEPNRNRLNLTIKANVQVMRIVLSGNVATGLEVESGGERFLVEGEQITLCAGAVGSPQLLMLSGIGPRDQLEPLDIPVVVDAPGVGQNMRDHPNVVVRFTVHEDRPDETVARRALRLRYTATASPTPNDMILSPSSLNTVVKEDVDPTHSINCGLYLAVGKGELRLVSTDPNVQPSMDYHYLEEPWDRERLREAVRKCVSLLKDGPYGEIVNQRTAPTDADLASDESLDDWMLRNVSTSFHISGTCKMGVADDPMAVVDQYLNVRGIQGLRIADASVMPDVVRANTNVTTMMIAERAVEFIRDGR
ncbi:MAG TPA: mycofactocin system GMC family oxidoreductase MftG [Dehalococcoidia bacterium]|jgi:choline dehydrogenase|nr:mycofactocin system GMC family oxidoreductase MftG [Dehalococcoidia bacterium]